jgi:thiosulfate/3-mercaptopyruvate sulfurtransferase
MTQRSNLIGTEELRGYLGQGGVRILDCRFDLGDVHAGRLAYEAGHIPGAVYADLDIDLSAPIQPDSGRHPLPGAPDFASTLGRLGIDNSTDVIVYDAGPGSLAARAWWMLRWVGHERVRLLDGGFQAWQTLGWPVVGGQERVAQRHFRVAARDDLIVTTADLSDDIKRIGALNLIDARDEARFRGEVEPIDTVAGHIPGARNTPFQLSLDDGDRWRPRNELQALWSETLPGDTDAASIVMCGSGVTACHLVISALEAGIREPRLYVGSWSEWIRDPARPIGLGEGSNEASQAADMA